MKRLNITDIVECETTALVPSVASDSEIFNRQLTHKSSARLNKKIDGRKPAQIWQTDSNHAWTDIGEGRIAVVDLADFALVVGHKWRPHRSGQNIYPATGRCTLLHTIVAGVEQGTRVDHRDGNTLNNRRENLRVATQSQNRANSRKLAPTKSKYKGVTSGPGGKWRVYVGPRSNRKYLGLFTDEMDAARAYDKKAVDLFGSFARLNFSHQST